MEHSVYAYLSRQSTQTLLTLLREYGQQEMDRLILESIGKILLHRQPPADAENPREITCESGSAD